MAHEEAVSNQHSAVSEKQTQHQHQRPFTAKDAEDAKESKPNPEQQAQALALKLAQTYEELTRLLERNPGVKRQITEGEAREDKLYQKLKQRLKLADMAPRCRWVRQGGTSCGSPQMKQHIYCFAHMQMAEARALMLRLPPPEDANAIQVGLMRIQKAVIEDTISMKKAGLLLYSMQLALTNVGQTTFGQAKDEEMVRETVDEETALSDKACSSQHSAVSEKQNQHQRPFTAEGAEDAEENRQNQHQTFETQRNGGSGGAEDLPQINADERGLRVESRPVEWTPSPDMYRMDTREGMEAYEASFRMKIRTSGDREATPPRAAGPHEPAQPLPKGPRFASEPLEASTQGSAFQAEPCANLG
ncbi:MAG TPA: hypothetical protein VFQ41_13000 [Candidatus Angelobacter sp.]|nr:hypothetical protein [Candidatus Angelobacter sp.]